MTFASHDAHKVHPNASSMPTSRDMTATWDSWKGFRRTMTTVGEDRFDMRNELQHKQVILKPFPQILRPNHRTNQRP